MTSREGFTASYEIITIRGSKKKRTNKICRLLFEL